MNQWNNFPGIGYGDTVLGTIPGQLLFAAWGNIFGRQTRNRGASALGLIIASTLLATVAISLAVWATTAMLAPRRATADLTDLQVQSGLAGMLVSLVAAALVGLGIATIATRRGNSLALVGVTMLITAVVQVNAPVQTPAITWFATPVAALAALAVAIVAAARRRRAAPPG
ncbi:MAG: hypothetical protein ACK5H2_13155 [Beutenbergiaceae bacterium]